TLHPDREKITGLRLEALTHETFGNKSLSRGNGNFVLTGFEVEFKAPNSDKSEPVKIVSALADYSQESYPIANAIDGKPETGWAVDGQRHTVDRKAVFVFEKPIKAEPNSTLTIRLRHESTHAQHIIGRFRIAITSRDAPTL